jgi:hypothetical protein
MIDVDFISNLPSSLHSAMSKYLFVKLEFASGSTSDPARKQRTLD